MCLKFSTKLHLNWQHKVLTYNYYSLFQQGTGTVRRMIGLTEAGTEEEIAPEDEIATEDEVGLMTGGMTAGENMDPGTASIQERPEMGQVHRILQEMLLVMVPLVVMALGDLAGFSLQVPICLRMVCSRVLTNQNL